jgi:pseudouridine synthase
MAEIRLQRFLSQAGIASRRKAEELITSGHVKVNGAVVRELGTKVDPSKDRVMVDGRMAVAEEKVYILLNKPKGVITTRSDPQGRPTVMELLPPEVAKSVSPVGRLDFYTEGVLLLTNDGELAAALLHPRHHVEKTYHVKIRGDVPMAHVERWREGVRLDDGTRTNPAKVDILRRTGKHTWLVMTIREGRSRQIHRMAEALHHQVIKLARVAFAGLTYFDLKIGEWRHLTPQEVREVRELAGLVGKEAEVVPALVDRAPPPPRRPRRETSRRAGSRRR